jgi:hypothetical protein
MATGKEARGSFMLAVLASYRMTRGSVVLVTSNYRGFCGDDLSAFATGVELRKFRMAPFANQIEQYSPRTVCLLVERMVYLDNAVQLT